jgi:WD40 repeat protein
MTTFGHSEHSNSQRLGTVAPALVLAVGFAAALAAPAHSDGADVLGQSPVHAVAFSPDGRLLATAVGDPGQAGELVVWDVASRKPRFIHREPLGVSATAFAPDGRALAIGVFFPVAKLLDVETGNVIRTFEGHTNQVLSVAFSKSGDQLVTGSFDRTVRLWDVGSGKNVRNFEGHGASVRGAALAPDGSILVSCSDDHTTRVWDPKTGEQKHVLSPTPLAVRDVTFSRDGRFFATCHFDAVVRIRETQSATLRAHIGTPGGAERAQFSPDGKTLAVIPRGTIIYLYDIDLSDPAPELRQKIAGLIARFDDDDFAAREAASADLAKIGMVAEPQLREVLKSESAEKRIRARRAQAKVSSPPARAKFQGHTGGLQCLAFSSDGKFLASADKEGVIKLWDAATQTEVTTLIAGGREP